MKCLTGGVWGGALLIAGTTIGAGILALPTVCGMAGFIPSLLLFVLCFLVMLGTAFIFLDLLSLSQEEVNFLSLFKKVLSTKGALIGSFTYLLLLYALLSAYLAGSAPFFEMAFTSLFGDRLPHNLFPFTLPLLFGGFVYVGMLGIDLLNRFLMVGLIASYLLLVVHLPSQLDPPYLAHVDLSALPVALPTVLAAFGYHIILPTLRRYLHHNSQQIARAIYLGSLIPLVVYIVWQGLTLGTIPLQGEAGSLANAYQMGVGVSNSLLQLTTSSWVKKGIDCFTFFAIITSFLGVSLSLSDFLTEGLSLFSRRHSHTLSLAQSKGVILLATFIPPLMFVFTFPRAFIIALDYGGAFVAILLIFFPAWMAYRLKPRPFYATRLGKVALVSCMLFACIVVASNLALRLNYLSPILSKYFS